MSWGGQAPDLLDWPIFRGSAPRASWHNHRPGVDAMVTAPLDTRSFRKTVGHFVTGVTVVVFEDGEGVTRAMTANSFTSLSLEPPLVLFCVGKESRTGQAIHEATRFSINILAEHQRDLSQFFAGAWRSAELPAFNFVDWAGRPRLEGCAAALACDLYAIHEGGDHWIVVGRVIGVETCQSEARPLVFFRGGYGMLVPGGAAAGV